MMKTVLGAVYLSSTRLSSTQKAFKGRFQWELAIAISEEAKQM